MKSNTLDASVVRNMFLAGARNLESKKEWINELNVFPVPDGDTGTNMTATIGEKISLRRVELVTKNDNQTFGVYKHMGGKIATVCVVEGNDAELAKDHFFTESAGLAIIDCMMNLPILFWASEVTGHPFYKRIAMMHADTTMKYFIPLTNLAGISPNPGRPSFLSIENFTRSY